MTIKIYQDEYGNEPFIKRLNTIGKNIKGVR